MLLKEAKRSGVSILDSEGVGPLLVSALIAVRNALVVDAKD
jgi:Ni,Fe-hydrogenase maturation factor